MGITMILSFIMMAGLFLMLFAGVALIKDEEKAAYHFYHHGICRHRPDWIYL